MKILMAILYGIITTKFIPGKLTYLPGNILVDIIIFDIPWAIHVTVCFIFSDRYLLGYSLMYYFIITTIIYVLSQITPKHFFISLAKIIDNKYDSLNQFENMDRIFRANHGVFWHYLLLAYFTVVSILLVKRV